MVNDPPFPPSQLEAGPIPAKPSSARKTPAELRSARWFGPADLRSFGHRSRAMQMGYSPEEWTGKPVIAIVNTWSDLQPCHMHFKQRVDDVKRGILMAGGFPVELPALSVSESYVKPTTMMYRNMLAMETEELLRSHPVDGAVLMGGCDKTTPGPAHGRHQHEHPGDLRVRLARCCAATGRGACSAPARIAGNTGTSCAPARSPTRTGSGVEGGIARSYGTCMTMGTASTMTAIAEAVGMELPGGSSIPAADAGHIRLCSESGRRIVDMVWEDLTPQKIQTRAAFENAIAVAMAMGCSTNAIIHLIAHGAACGPGYRTGRFRTLQPPRAGDRQRAPVRRHVPDGGLLLRRRHPRADGPHSRSPPSRRLTVTGRTVGENIEGARVFNDDVIRSVENPIYGEGSLAVLKGNLAPDGCVIKPAAMDQRFLKHSGPALVFDDYPSMKKAVDDENLDITADHVLVLRNAGPQGGPGMPEWGMLPMPKKLLKEGHRDMLRMSDARMSGTSYGACVLHVSPEAYIGGPLALLRTGDIVSIDVGARSIRMEVPDEELERRRAAWKAPEPRFERGYGWVFTKHIQQANEGCDFDFLRTDFGAPVPEPVIY